MGHCERRDGGYEWILSSADIERMGGCRMLDIFYRAQEAGPGQQLEGEFHPGGVVISDEEC